jgi:hypothetical protein
MRTISIAIDHDGFSTSLVSISPIRIMIIHRTWTFGGKHISKPTLDDDPVSSYLEG